MVRNVFWAGIVAALLLLAGCGTSTGGGTATAVPSGGVSPTSTAVTAAGSTPTVGAPSDMPNDLTKGPAADAIPLTKVVVAMGYVPNVQFAPFYVAQDKGYYAAAGLQVEFQYGQVNDLLRVVAAGKIDFANVSGDEMVPAAAQGIPVRYVMAQYYRYPVAAAAIAGQGAPLRKPADLKGRKVGIPGLYGSTYIGLKALLKAGGLQESDIREQSIGFTQVSALLQHQVDTAMTYSMNEPVQIRSQGQTVQTLEVSDYVNLAAVGLATSTSKITANPAQVRGFVHATQQGIADTLADPEAAFASSMKRTPEIGAAGKPLQRAVLTATLPFMTPPAGRTPGMSDAQTWTTTESFLREIGLTKTAVDPATLYTNDFVR